jgi:hypothetical protein
MIGKEVYYIENNVVCKSDIVSCYLQERFEDSKDVMITLRSGVVMNLEDACYSINELFIKLNRDFNKRLKG